MSEPQSASPSLYVGVGASAGGLDAFKTLLGSLPPRSGMTFVLVQHLDPTHRSMLTELLEPLTEMAVKEAENGEALVTDTIYVIPSDAALAVEDGCISLTPASTSRGARLSVDHLFRSLARDQGHRAVGIVLSGAGSDGSAGIRAIKAAGGLVLVQEPQSCVQTGMPQAAIDTGVCDLVLPIPQMAEALRRFLEMPPPAREKQHAEGPQHDPAFFDASSFKRLAALLDAGVGFDLSVYKNGTVGRRVARRMGLGGFDAFDDYLEHLRQEPAEQQVLIQDMLIRVTDFFRDPEAFDALRTLVIDPLMESVSSGDVVRAWVAGCASGEEAYSVAIEILEAAERLGKRITLQLFATDVDEDALAIARAAEYPETIAERMSAERLRRYFSALNGRGYKVRRVLRDRISFARHDLPKDPPLSRMDIVSCRNVLIYLRPRVQQQVLKTLHFALQPKGALFLGSSETTGSQRERFSTLSKPWRIFRKVGSLRPEGRAFDSSPSSTSFAVHRRRQAALPGAQAERGAHRANGVAEVARRRVLQEFVPPSVVLSDSGSVLYMHGELRPFLQFPEGEPRFDLISLVTPSLATRARAALYKSRRTGERVVAVTSPGQDDEQRVRVTAVPLTEVGDGVVMLSFEALDTVAVPRVPQTPSEESLVVELEQELRATREDLRNTVEELESANEELRSTNEEAMSMNEELQSANEELEASTEELRSLNEELTTVNAQLRDKVEQLERAQNDNANFFASTRIATLFLDEDLSIQRFTPAAETLLHINHADAGRYVGDIARELLQGDLVQQSTDVLEHLSPRTCELTTSDGETYTRRVLPYRTEHRRIEGVVVTWFNITAVKQATRTLQRRERQQAVIAELGIRALEETSFERFLASAVESTRDAVGATACKVLELQPGREVMLLRAGVGWTEGQVGSVCVDNVTRYQSGYTLLSAGPVIANNIREDERFTASPLVQQHGLNSGMSCTVRQGDEVYGILAVFSREERNFSNEDADFLQASSNVIGAAIGRHSARVQGAFERAAAEAMAVGRDLVEAFTQCSKAVSNDLQLAVSELWTQGVHGRITQVAAWPAPAARADGETGLGGEAHPATAAELVERVAERQQAEWVTVHQPKATFALRPDMASLSVRSGLAFPIVSNGVTKGVVTYFFSESLFADAAFLRALERVGRSMGDFVRQSEMERRHQQTVERAPLGIAERAVDGRLLRVNERFCTITGYSEAELLSLAEPMLTHPEDRWVDGPPSSEEPKAGTGRIIEKRYLRKDGDPVWVSVSESWVDGAVGAQPYSILVVEDITQRKRAKSRLQASEEQFRQVLVNSPALMFIFDDQDNVVALSKSWEEMTGYSIEEMPNIRQWMRTVFEVPEDEIDEQIAQTWSRADSSYERELDLLSGSGERRTFMVRGGPMGTTADGRRLRIVAALDITARRHMEMQLVEADRLKNEFLAMLGHELRNPLSAIRTAAESIRATQPHDERIQRMHGILERQCRHMAKLLDGLLDVSRVVHGKIALSYRVIDLGQVVDQTASDHAIGLPEGVSLVWELPKDPVWVDGDSVRLQQIVDNLLSNALKFVEVPGRVEVAVEVVDGRGRLRVMDDGVGIESDLLPHLFEPFLQGKQRLDRSSGGLGLGLALVKSLTELHGGSVSVSSLGPGEGCEFVVELPLSNSRPVARPVIAPSLDSRRILVVEDHEDAAQAMREVLDLAGHDVRIAHSAEDALVVMQGFAPHAVLCDIGLPGTLSGLDLARRLREDREHAAILLVAVSGYGTPADRERSLEAGFDEHLNKPVTVQSVLSTLARLGSH